MIVLSVAPALCVAFTAPLRIVLVRKCLESLEILEISERSKHKQNIRKHEQTKSPETQCEPCPDAKELGDVFERPSKGLRCFHGSFLRPSPFSMKEKT